MGCGCNSKKVEDESEYGAEEERSIGGPMGGNPMCQNGKESFSEREAPLYDTFIALFTGIAGFFASSAFKVERLSIQTGIVVVSVLIGNVVSKNMKWGQRLAGMRFDSKCKGDE